MEELLKSMESIKYGWKDKNGNIHLDVDDTFSEDYVLESPEEVFNNKVGVCWDQVEYERKYFDDNNISYNTYFIVHYDNDRCPTHTFLIYNMNNKYYWFEHSWEIHRGIHEYNSEEEALKDIKNKFINFEVNNYIPDNLCIYKYDKPSYGISVQEFYKHCEHGINIII